MDDRFVEHRGRRRCCSGACDPRGGRDPALRNRSDAVAAFAGTRGRCARRIWALALARTRPACDEGCFGCTAIWGSQYLVRPLPAAIGSPRREGIQAVGCVLHRTQRRRPDMSTGSRPLLRTEARGEIAPAPLHLSGPQPFLQCAYRAGRNCRARCGARPSAHCHFGPARFRRFRPFWSSSACCCSPCSAGLPSTLPPEPLLERIAQSSAEPVEFGCCAVSWRCKRQRGDGDAGAGRRSATCRIDFPSSSAAAFEQGHRALLEAVTACRRTRRALEAIIQSAIETPAAQQRTADDATFRPCDRFRSFKNAVEELTAVLRRLSAAPERTEEPAFAGRQSRSPQTPAPGLARELRRLLQEIDAAR